MLAAYMDLNLTPTELAFRDQVRGWLAANVPADWEKHRAEDEMQARFEFLLGWQKKVFEAGWAGIAWPTEYGGKGLTLLQQLTIFSVATLTSKGASGVQGASFIALVATCRSFLQFRWREWRSFSASIDS